MTTMLIYESIDRFIKTLKGGSGANFSVKICLPKRGMEGCTAGESSGVSSFLGGFSPFEKYLSKPFEKY